MKAWMIVEKKSSKTLDKTRDIRDGAYPLDVFYIRTQAEQFLKHNYVEGWKIIEVEIRKVKVVHDRKNIKEKSCK